jgi:hypothetical protein
MVKLTAENIHGKLGHRVAVSEIDSLNLPSAQIDDVCSFLYYEHASFLHTFNRLVRLSNSLL